MSTEIWSFKYEPKTLDEMILDPAIREKLEKATNDYPNIMLYGQPGTGKGTFMNVFFKKTGLDHMKINASDQTGIDAMRDSVKPFAHGGSSAIKYVVLNESEALSTGKSGAQKMLKDLMEMVQKKTRFLFMTNEIDGMNDALRSRCMEINLDTPPIKEIILYMSTILKLEGIKYDPKTLIQISKDCYPDIRKTLWTLQENTIGKELKTTIVQSSAKTVQKEILENIKKADVDGIRTLLKNNYVNYQQLYEFLYTEIMDSDTEWFKLPGDAILQIGDHLRFNETTCNAEINFMHMIFDMIWKKII